MIKLDSTSLLRRSLAEPAPRELITTIAEKSRVIPISHARHMRGWHPVRPNHSQVPFESRLEAKFISEVAQFPQFRAIRSQPITALYTYDGRQGRYTPDFLLELSSVPTSLADLGFGKRTYVEIKPFTRALKDKDRLARKFSALRQATGLPVILVTDLDLRELALVLRHEA